MNYPAAAACGFTLLTAIFATTTVVPQDSTALPPHPHLLPQKLQENPLTLTNASQEPQNHPRRPTTPQPTVGDFRQPYQLLRETTDEIVDIHISAKLRGTLNSANQAREQYQGDGRIEIVDSQQGSMGLGMVAIAANQAAQRGASIDEVVREAQLAIPRVQFFGLLDTLEYLVKGGRIGKAQGFVGSLLRIKPILVVRDGEVHPLERARTRAKGIDRLCEWVQETMPRDDLAVV